MLEIEAGSGRHESADDPRILGAAGYGPEQLALVTGVLESVWARCKADFPADQVEAARERLALTIVDLAGRDVPAEPGAFEALVQVAFERQMERASRPLNGRK